MPSDLFTWRDYLAADAVPTIAPWKPHALTHEQWPPSYRSVYAWRIRTVNQLRENPELLASAKAYYVSRPAEFIMHWMDTYNPRKDTMKWIPFVFFKRQIQFIEFLQQCRKDAQSGLVEKCRDAGATWLSCAYSVHSWLFVANDAIGWGSRKEVLVDKLGDPDSIFEKMRLLLRRMPSVFMPAGFDEKKHATFMKLINPENGSIIAGEAGDNIGRGGRKALYFKDEAQPLNAGILTPTGWSTMGDIQIGSNVIGSNGKSCVVTNINDVGLSPVYRIDFSDGTSTECSENHLWTVEKKWGKRSIETLRAIQLIDNIRYVSPSGQTQYKYRIPITQPVHFKDHAVLPLDPWIVGALIGDGSVGNGVVSFTSNDPENVVRFVERAPKGTKLTFDCKYTWRFVDAGNRYNKSSIAKNAVKSSGIYGMRSEPKYIPDIYKFASVNNRIELLRGLMDTDGSASGGVASYHTCSEKLANDVRFIVQSLGGTATINVKPDHRDYRDMFVLHMFIPNINPFHLFRKRQSLSIRKHLPDKTIMNIEYIRDDIVRCITVDAKDGLYLTDHCIITHNSAHYPRPELIEAALGDNTNVQIDISSVNGLGNVFHRRRSAGKLWFPGATIEPGYTRVFIIDWRDHPEKTQKWYDSRRAKFEREGMLHVFKQEVDRDYSGAVSNTVIPMDWIVASIDAHNKIPILIANPPGDNWMAGQDIADEGVDRNALALRQGIIARKVTEWGERDPGVSARRAIAECRALPGVVRCMYDSIGIGSNVKSEFNRLVEAKVIDPAKIRMVPWNAGGKVLEPYARVIPDDDETLCNDDFFHNIKAQAWWSVRARFYKTWACIQAIANGDPIPDYSADELISLDGTMPLLHQLTEELAQPTKGESSRLKMLINKKPNGMKSPNLADAFIMCYFPIPDNYSTVYSGTIS